MLSIKIAAAALIAGSLLSIAAPASALPVRSSRSAGVVAPAGT